MLSEAHQDLAISQTVQFEIEIEFAIEPVQFLGSKLHHESASIVCTYVTESVDTFDAKDEIK